MNHLKIIILFSLATMVLMGACKEDLFEEEIVDCPMVESTDPEDQATSVPNAQIISVVFNKEMDPSTINSNSIIVDGVSGTVSYSGFTATFTPSSPLDPNSIFVGRVKTSARDLYGLALEEEYVWTFSTGASLSPIVVSVDPENESTGVVLNITLIASFNMPMTASTINDNTFTVTQAGTEIDGTVSYSGLQAFFEPDEDFSTNTEYTATLTTGVENTAGEGMANDYVWTFTTGTDVAPTVVLTDPGDNEADVQLDKVITATFSEPMDPSTLDGNTFLMMGIGAPVTGEVSYSGTTAIFTPSSPLSPGTLYTVAIVDDVQSASGIPLANDHIWTFSTASGDTPTVVSIDPAHNEADVPLNKTITATFSEQINPSTLDGTSFLLLEGTEEVSGEVTYDGFRATFTPNSDLKPNTLYSATITTDVENLTGEGMASNFDWSFTTASEDFNPTVDLRSVDRFGIISGEGISNNAGASQINDLDIGVYPGVRSSITGFSLVDGGPGLINNGNIYASDDPAPVPSMLSEAKNDLTTAYLAAEGAIFPAPVTVSGDLGGQTLAPGIYKSNSTLSIQNGNLTLDGQGDPNAEWIFQVSSALTTIGGAPFPSPTGGNVILTGGAQAKNVTWQVGSSATIGDYTSFNGNVLALTSITMNSFSQANGRMLTSNGAVTLTSTNTINKP